MLSEKTLESRQNVLRHESDRCLKERPNFIPCRRSFSESYKANNGWIHLHLSGNDSDRTNLCIAIRKSWIDQGVSQSKLVPCCDQALRDRQCTQYSEQHPTVFVDIRELLQIPKEGLLDLGPSEVRLQSLDLCDYVCMNPAEPPTSKLVRKALCRVADGKRVLFSGLLFVGEHEFPYQVIECRTEILEGISHDDGDMFRGRLRLEPTEDVLFSTAIGVNGWISHELCGMSVVIPRNLNFESVEVLVGSTDL